MSEPSSYAVVFPGQGSQAVGMLSALYAEDKPTQELFAQASEVLGYDLWQLCQQGPADQLNQTVHTQPAVLTADVAMWRYWQRRSARKPAVLAGHSLGEYSALVCAESLPFEQAVSLVAKRGEFMQQAVPIGQGAMASIIALDAKIVAKLCKQCKEGSVSPANFNSIGHTVISGEKTAVEAVVLAAKDKGAKLAKLLPVSVPSHCELMTLAAEKMAEELQRVDISPPKIPVLHNVDVATHSSPSDIAKVLVAQLTGSVRWVETIQKLAKMKMDTIIECGPGKVLTGLNKRIEPSLTYFSLNTPEQVAQLLETEGVA